MSTTSEYEPVARQDYGPATASENVYEELLDHKLVDMNVSSIRTPVLRALPVSPSAGEQEPDSTNPEGILLTTQQLDKEVEYHIAEKKCDSEMSVDSLSGIVRIEEATLDSVGRISYPILQEADDSNDGHYVNNTSAALIQGPLNTAIVQNVTKLPQNFTINVDAAVGNITAIQNVSQDVSSNQTLWLPTILATSAAPDSKGDDIRPQAGVSQIIITSESYVNDSSQVPQAITDTNFIGRSKSSKVQILSNISIPKNTNYSQQYISQGKDVTPVYGTQNHVYKLSTNVMPQKHLNNSVLCTMPPKSQSLIGCSTLPPGNNSSPIKNISYSRTFTKGTNLNKTLNKVNNGANLNALVAASTGSTQCHILSRVVSGPNKMSVHSGRKSVNTFKGKNSQVAGSQKSQSRAIKIIQQAGSSSHKSDGKPWPLSNVMSQGPQSYGVMEAKSSKIIQKVGSPNHKAQPQQLPKTQIGERLILQSPCGPVLISTAPISTSLPKGPHYVQSGSTPNLRYVQTHGTDNQLSAVSQVSANQQLTAQILQSLSQPKLLLHPNQPPINHTPLVMNDEELLNSKMINQKRIVFGDKSTSLMADDIIGMEERPNLPEEFRRYSFHSLAFAMLDHTYALPSQKHQAPSTPPAPVPPPPPMPAVITSPQPVVPSSPLSPLKRCSPVIMSTASYDMPLTVPPSVIGSPVPVSTLPIGMSYKTAPLPADEDTASVISSLDGDRKNPGGSDTETAPEIEEEGKTRCICDFTHDDGYMICCDRCGEWQHVDCMGVDRNNIPDAYMCEVCNPRPVDRRHARAIQLRKREELSALGASDSDSSELTRLPGQRRKRLLTVTTYTNTTGPCATYNAPPPVAPPVPQPSLTLPKRGPKRTKKTEVLRKGSKRKLTEKRVKRKKEMMLNRSKYGSSLSNQSHWQDSYELAVTNHYSPELRAKIMKYSSKLGNTPNMASATTAHMCTTVPHAGGKILIATKDLKDNMPIIELRGKYMLSTQHRPQLQNSARAGSQKPGPFVFFYKLPRDNIQICIDTRTYGNEARFVRRSCKPNAELQHCIVKGALHVYLVTLGTVQSDTEITVGHDSNGGKQPCACGNPKHCKVNGLNPLLSRKSIEYPSREKRSRNRQSSLSSPVSPPPMLTPVTPIKEQLPFTSHIKSEKKSPIKHEYAPISPSKSVITALQFDEPIKKECESFDEKPEFDLTTKEEMKPEIDEPDFAKIELIQPKEPELVPKLELEPEKEPELEKPPPPPEPKPEEQLDEKQEEDEEEEEEDEEEEVEKEEKEKTPSPKKEKEVKVEKEPFFSDEEKCEKSPKFEKKIKEEPLIKEERIMTRELAAKSACHDRSSRSSRTITTCVNQDSMDDKTDDSQDKLPTKSNKDKKKMTREERKMEAIMKAFERMEKAEQRKQEVKERQKRRESDPHPNATEKDDDDSIPGSTKKRKKRKSRARTTSQSNRRRLNSADSEPATSGDEAPLSSSHADESANHAPSEDIGLSPACLLVEAAVGSVESAFKLPKTKKTIATEWAGRSPERTPSPYRSPYAGSLATGSLESLVRVASSIIGDLSADHEPRALSHQHSAKKRWLRQAISEESDSPTPESPPNEMVTPLKKRRLARESLSCEQNSVVPCNEETSPNLTSEDSPVKDDPTTVIRQYKVRNIMDSLYGRDRTRSDSGQGSDDQCNNYHDVLNVDIKAAHDSENIRRIIGVPTPEDEAAPELPEREDKTNNNNVDLDETKVVPMEIDAAISHPKIEENIQSLQEKGIESPNDKVNSSQSADTSGNSSPQRDEMDDIQKKIHSFHTENILMLKSRNKKPPKEKRKKVNLNFDLNMVDDQISVQLRTERILSGEEQDDGVHENAKIYVCSENIPLPPSESMPNPENIPFPDELSLTPLNTIPFPSSPPPSDKRKKVNLNFDLNMVDDQISVQLRKDRNNGNLHDVSSIHENAKIHVSPEYIPLPEEPSPRHKRRTNIPMNVNGDFEDTRIHVSPSDIPLPPEENPNSVQDEPIVDKRRKVNLNFDLSMVDDRVSVELRTDSDFNGDNDMDSVHDNAKIHVSPEYIPLPPLESVVRPVESLRRPFESVSRPFESVVRSVESVVRPLESVVRSLESVVRTESVVQPVDSIIRPVDSGLRPAESVLRPVESVVRTVESVCRPFESVGRQFESVVRPLESVVRPVESVVRTVESVSRPFESVVRATESVVRPVEAVVRQVESVVRSLESVLQPVESVVRPLESIERPSQSVELVAPFGESMPVAEAIIKEKDITESPQAPMTVEPTVPFSSRFSTTSLFSGIFGGVSQFSLEEQSDENLPNMSIIKSAIDRTTLESGIFDKESRTQVDELRSVQEILTRVNNMDSNNSVLLSGVLKNSNKTAALQALARPVVKPYSARINDPRLNPPPADKPKPVRRKLSISEYRKRQQCGGGAAGEESSGSPGSPGPSPPRLDAADELDHRLQKDLTQSYVPKGIFDAQPTASERQRENLSSRLRREFGLALPDEDDEPRPTSPPHSPHPPGTASTPDPARLQTLDLDKLTESQVLDCIGVNADVSLGVNVNQDGSVSGYTTVAGPHGYPTVAKTSKDYKLDSELSALNKQREDLSSRLKREFGLALNEEESLRSGPPDALSSYFTANVPGSSQAAVGYTTVEFAQKQGLNQNPWQKPADVIGSVSPGGVSVRPQVSNRYQRIRPYGSGRGRGRALWRHRGGYTM